jgi:hypothetical protein
MAPPHTIRQGDPQRDGDSLLAGHAHAQHDQRRTVTPGRGDVHVVFVKPVLGDAPAPGREPGLNHVASP